MAGQAVSRPVVFSGSSVYTYDLCSLQWWFTYIAALPSRPSYEMALGTAIHAAAEKVLRIKLLETFDPEDPGTKALIEREAVAAYRQSIVDEGRAPTEQGDALIALLLRDVMPLVEPMLIEQPFELLVNGIPYSGILDTYDKAFILWDYKSTGSRPSRNSTRYRFPMVGYALGARDLTGAEEAGIRLAYLVKTKTPYYWPVDSPPIDEDDIEWFASQLERVAESVAQGIFNADGLYGRGTCKTCPFTAECGPYQRLQEKT
jgi:hypothetical protein